MTYIGQRVPRVEDPRLLRGEGRYVGDLTFPGMLHAGFVRSPHAHARVLSVDVTSAGTMPGIVAAYAAADFPEVARPIPIGQWPEGLRARGFAPLAADVTRFVGEAVAVVLGESPAAVADAVDAVEVQWEPLEAVIDPEAALRDEVRVWPDVPDNLALEMETGFGDVDDAFQQADIVVEERFALARSAPAAMEPRAVAAVPDGARLTIWASSQAPHNVRNSIADYFGLEPDAIRVVVPDVGGGFGPKGRVYPEEYVVSALARRHARPVRWVATRTEDLMTTAHGRGQIHYAALAARADGTILGIRDSLIQDTGAHALGVMTAMNTTIHLMGPYRVPALGVSVRGVYTNKVMISPLRGGGRPEGVYVVERLLDRLAGRLGLDRAEVRRRNVIPPEAFPYDTGMRSARGQSIVYDSGRFPEYLERACEAIGWQRFAEEQAQARAEGRYLGIGLAAFIESTGTGSEEARVAIDEEGAVTVAVGSPDNGQGHFTTFAQMAGARLGVPIERVTVSSGDTGAGVQGTGTFASRMGLYGGNAVSMAALAVREKALAIAADLLEIAAADLEIVDGGIQVRGAPSHGISLGEVAQEAVRRDDPLEESHVFEPSPAMAWAGGVNAAVVEVDIHTGQVGILRYVVVHDCGTIVNPLIVEGQIQGGVTHGAGNVLLERCAYDSSGQILTASFADYAIPGFWEAPAMDIVHVESPSPFNPEGIKGAGEGGTIAAIPTLVSAIENALRPFQASINDVPVLPEAIVRLSSSE